MKAQPKPKRLVSAIRKVLDVQGGGERKFFDTALSFAPANTLTIPATGQLSLIPQNDTQSGRDGRKAVVDSIYIHGEVTVTKVANTEEDQMNIWVVLDKQANGAAATAANADTGVFTTNDQATLQRTLANIDRFIVLGQIKVLCNFDGGGAGASTLSVPFAWSKKVNVPVEFDPRQ